MFFLAGCTYDVQRTAPAPLQQALAGCSRKSSVAAYGLVYEHIVGWCYIRVLAMRACAVYVSFHEEHDSPTSFNKVACLE